MDRGTARAFGTATGACSGSKSTSSCFDKQLGTRRTSSSYESRVPECSDFGSASARYVVKA